jgi:hypothetical protein
MNSNAQQRSRQRRTWALLAGMAGALGACTATDAAENAVRTAYGEPVALGKGVARGYVTMVNGAPSEVGFALSEGALQGLPDHHSPGGIEMEPGHQMFETLLALPVEAPAPYEHLYLTWNPTGHEPPGLYDAPHFDFHFYWVPEAERLAIDPRDPDFEAKGARHPTPERQPAGYVAVPVAVPFMGTHWIDPGSAEFSGEPFTRTFIYGSWNGRMIFAEPMVTRAFLESKPDFTAPVPAAARYDRPGYYPTSYSVRWDAGAKEYRVALTGLVRRD